MDFLKSDVLLWKKEIRTDGESWIEPRAQDYDDEEVEELMHGINESLTFTPVSIAVMTVSDTRTPETDTSGDILAQRLQCRSSFGGTMHCYR